MRALQFGRASVACLSNQSTKLERLSLRVPKPKFTHTMATTTSTTTMNPQLLCDVAIDEIALEGMDGLTIDGN